MATPEENGVLIANGLVNGVAPAALRNRLGRACARWCGRGEEYDAGNATVKALVGWECIRVVMIQVVRHTEGTDAKEATEAAVDAAFAPAVPKP
jgi:hypothetical protein